MKRLKMNDGHSIPSIGFGVYQSPAGPATYEAVMTALRTGYRHIDTAAVYGNEEDVGRAIRDSEIPREEIFVTTKLWNSDQGFERALAAFEKSEKKLDVGAIDLYLLHWPVQLKRLDSWRALEQLRAEGRVKSIGVSNFTVRHLRELLDHALIKPVVNQVEFSPFLYQRELLGFCATHSIFIQAYSPLTRGQRLDNKNVMALAKKYERTPAQILIRWCLERGTIPLPKSNRPERIRENFSVFDFKLSPEDASVLDSLNEEYHTSWDPTAAP